MRERFGEEEKRESVRLRDTVLAYFDMQIRASHSACSEYDQHV